MVWSDHVNALADISQLINIPKEVEIEIIRTNEKWFRAV